MSLIYDHFGCPIRNNLYEMIWRSGHNISSVCKAAGIDRPNFSKWLHKKNSDIKLETISKILQVVCPEHTTGEVKTSITLNQLLGVKALPNTFVQNLSKLRELKIS